MARVTHKINLNNTLTPLGCQCKQIGTTGALAVVNLTGLTVKFSMVDSAGTLVVDHATTGVTVTDAANGKVQYDFQAADVDVAGTFYGWFSVYSGAEFDDYPVGRQKLVIEITDPAA